MPLRMDNTSADNAKKEIKNRAVFYEVKDGRYKEVYPVNNSINGRAEDLYLLRKTW